jgi:hypothetical protein
MRCKRATSERCVHATPHALFEKGDLFDATLRLRTSRRTDGVDAHHNGVFAPYDRRVARRACRFQKSATRDLRGLVDHGSLATVALHNE